VLNRIFRENDLSPDLYYKLKESIEKQDNETERTEIIDFLEDLPYRLRISATMYLYKDAYTNVQFLYEQKSDNFLAWICPLLVQSFIAMDQYVYYETDLINDVYF